MIRRICCAARIRQSMKFIAVFAAALSLAAFNTTTTMALSIASVEVDKGPTAGGNEVTIRGDGFLRTVNQQDEIIQLAGTANPNDLMSGTVIALTKNGRVYSYGSNVLGSAGTGQKCYRASSEGNVDSNCYYYTPQNITNKFSGKVTHIYQIRNFDEYATNLAITDNGMVYVWGKDAKTLSGGEQDETSCEITPTLIDDVSNLDIKAAMVDPQYGEIAFYNDNHVIIGGYDNDSSLNWVDIDLSAQLKNDKIASLEIAGAHLYIITTDNRLLVSSSQCSEQNDNASNRSLIQTIAPDCLQLIDITSDFGPGVLQARYGYVINSNGDVLSLDGTNITDLHELPKSTSIVGTSYSDGYDGILLLTDDHNVRNLICRTKNSQCVSETIISNVNVISEAEYDGIPNQRFSYTEQNNDDTIFSRDIATAMRSTYEKLPPLGSTSIPLETTSAQIPTVKAISFGDVVTTDFATIDNNTIKAIVPAHAVGKVDVVLHSIDGEASNVTLTKSYEYIADTAVGAPNTGIGLILNHPLTVLGGGVAIASLFAIATHKRQSRLNK